MGKSVSLEIATMMRPRDRSAIAEVIGAVDRELVDILGLRGGWVTNHETNRARKSGAGLLESSKPIRYIHYTRATDKVSMSDAATEVFGFVVREHPDLRVKDAIGEVDLITRVESKVLQKLGRCSLEGMVHRFDTVDIVDPIKDVKDRRKVFVLRQFAHATDEESVTALDLVSNEINTRIQTAYPDVDRIGVHDTTDEVNIGLEKSIPVASLYLHDKSKQEFDPKLLEYVRKAIFNHLIDPTFDFESHELDIAHEI